MVNPHPGLILASHTFREPYPHLTNNSLLSLSAMDLLMRNAYPRVLDYAKFTILLTIVKEPGVYVQFSIGNAIPLTFDDGGFIPKSDIYAHIRASLLKCSERYEGTEVRKITIRVYCEGSTPGNISLSQDEIIHQFNDLIHSSICINALPAKKIQNKKKKYAENYITSLKSTDTKLKPFLVADMETLFMNQIHMPYAAGVMMVETGDNLATNSIYSYFSEDYSPVLYTSFEERSSQLLSDFINRISIIIKQNPEIKTVYFHNFGRFDGIFIIKHIALHHTNYKLKPLMRNNQLYELALYEGDRKLFRFRDSLHLLPGKLDNLAKSLCPELGSKGSIDYDSVTLSNLGLKKKDLLDYMRQDIMLLGGVMQKAQKLYLEYYSVDLVSKVTCSSLALTIYRMKFYDDQNHRIHIPNQNADRFIRSGYYGGHTDAYKKYGENLYYYDVNSLYPFIMKEYSIPGGEPVWHGNLGDREIETLFVFISRQCSRCSSSTRPYYRLCLVLLNGRSPLGKIDSI